MICVTLVNTQTDTSDTLLAKQGGRAKHLIQAATTDRRYEMTTECLTGVISLRNFSCSIYCPNCCWFMFNKRAPVFQQRLLTFFFVFQGNSLKQNENYGIGN